MLARGLTDLIEKLTASRKAIDGTDADVAALTDASVRLLELIDETGSISAAGRALEMSYRQAWLLVDELNRMFRDPVVSAQTGGGGGGGTVVTETGKTVVRLYRAMERRSSKASNPDVQALSRLLNAAAK